MRRSGPQGLKMRAQFLSLAPALCGTLRNSSRPCTGASVSALAFELVAVHPVGGALPAKSAMVVCARAAPGQAFGGVAAGGPAGSAAGTVRGSIFSGTITSLGR